MEGRFALASKKGGVTKEKAKARFVVQGFRDKMKYSLGHDSATYRQVSAHALVGPAADFCFRIFSTDVTQATGRAQKSYSGTYTYSPVPIWARTKKTNQAYSAVAGGLKRLLGGYIY